MDAEKTPTKPRPSITRWQQLRGVLHRVLELVRKPPHLTTAAALLGVTILTVLVWVHAAAYTRDSTQNATLAYHLALSRDAQADFLPRDGKLYLNEWLAYGVERVPRLYADVREGRMTKQLGLDEAQQQRVGPINLDRFKKIEEAKATNSSNKSEVQSKVKAINEDYNNNIKGVLSAEQFTKFLAMEEEMKKKAFEKKQNRH